MAIQEEFKIEGPSSPGRKVLLSILRTSALLMRLSDRFFSQFGTTDIQFNILMILNTEGAQGLSQQELSERLVVTKSNIVGLMDRMERQGIVQRKPHPTDRRFHRIVITAKGKRLFEKVEGHYYKEVNRITAALNDQEIKFIPEATEKIRTYLRESLGEQPV